MLGLGSYDPGSSYLGGFAEASLAEQNGYPPTQQMGGSFNNMYGQPSFGASAYGGSNFGSPFSCYPPQRPCCCCCGYRGF